MPKYTFHLPKHDYDEVVIEGDDLNDASHKLYEQIQDGTVEPENENIGCSEPYWKEEALDCVAMDESGEQLR